MSLRQKRYLSLGTMVCGIILMIFSRNKFLDIAGIAVFAIGIALNIVMVHCPKCNAWIGQHPGEFCRYCGVKINWDAKKE